ncbi:MAG TPA: thiamine phosphate synthase [Solirubrobacteraceae bacterium]|jgi:thiamine-phosphate pyrophosphorylase
MNDDDPRRRLSTARLYLVCGAEPARHDLFELIRAAAAGGVDVFQLREKHMEDARLVALAERVQTLCGELGVLFVLNDRPDLAALVGTDGVHVGQEDMPPTAVREIVGERMLIGLSTHATAEIDAVDAGLVDYIGVGPVHATPTKPGRPAVGLELVRHAAASAHVPFFAIGGLDATNARDVLEAGARRICVLRAIADVEDPTAEAAGLRALLDESGPVA